MIGFSGQYKLVPLSSNVKGEQLVQLLADKFHLKDIVLPEWAVFDKQRVGEPTMLEEDDSPIVQSLSWKNPCDGEFILKKLPKGLQRVTRKVCDHTIHILDMGILDIGMLRALQRVTGEVCDQDIDIGILYLDCCGHCSTGDTHRRNTPVWWPISVHEIYLFGFCGSSSYTNLYRCAGSWRVRN